jgi:hypothetical protein
MFNLEFFDQWLYHIIGWPLLIILLLTLLFLRVNWKIATLMVPLSLASLGWMMYDLEKTLGRPYASMPHGKWLYVYHRITGSNIELLVVDKGGTRLYTIKNTEQAKKALEQAKAKSEQGIPQEGEVKEKPKVGGTVGEDELTLHDLNINQVLRKNEQ